MVSIQPHNHGQLYSTILGSLSIVTAGKDQSQFTSSQPLWTNLPATKPPGQGLLCCSGEVQNLLSQGLQQVMGWDSSLTFMILMSPHLLAVGGEGQGGGKGMSPQPIPLYGPVLQGHKIICILVVL